METIKRQAFILGLVAGVVVISLAAIATVYFVYVGPNADTRQVLRSTKTRAQKLQKGPLFSEDLVNQMAAQVDRRKKEYEGLVDHIRQLGAARKPLVENLFPISTDTGLRHSFKGKYDEALAGFMTRLGAVIPAVPAGKDAKVSEADMKALSEENCRAAMFAHPKASFFRPDWVDRQDAPGMDTVRYSQEDLWLMEDLVEIIATMNDEIRKAKGLKPVIADSPVKELIEIRIGSELALLPGTKMATVAGRYRPAYTPGARATTPGSEARAPALSGRHSQTDFYLLLPWRMAAVVDARYAGELVRRLKGRESFLSVDAWRLTPINDATFERAGKDLLALSRDDYGTQGVAKLEVTGESMVFQLPGSRITTVVKAPAPPKTEPKAEPDDEPEAAPKKKARKS